MWWRSVLHYCTFPLIIIQSEDSEDNEVCLSAKTTGNIWGILFRDATRNS